MPLSGATVVFDLDGTVADTAPDLVDAANAALAAEGLPPASAEAIATGVGYGTEAMLRAALASHGMDAGGAQMQRLADRLVSHYRDNIAVKTTVFPGFAGAAASLRRDGAKLALCTNKRADLAAKVLSALNIGELFETIAGGDTFPFHKPDPRHITEAVRRAGGDPRVAVMIGDSEADIAAAQAGGIPSIAVRFGYASIPPDRLGANAVADRFSDIPPLVHRLLEPLLQR